MFDETTDGYLVNRKVETVRNRALEISEVRAIAGAKGAAKGKAFAMSKREAPYQSIPIHKKEETPNPLEVAWDVFWKRYPRRENRGQAKKAWMKLKPNDATRDKMYLWLDEAEQSEQWQDKTKIPHASTFLNQRRWEGDPPPRAKRSLQGDIAPAEDWEAVLQHDRHWCSSCESPHFWPCSESGCGLSHEVACQKYREGVRRNYKVLK